MSRKPWVAEWPWTEDEAAEAIATVAPELKGPVTRLGEGWDCQVFRIEDAAFRFPKRALGLDCIENELRVLPQLPELGVPIPRVRWVGQARGRPFYGHTLIRGHSADHLALTDNERAGLAAPLATLLKRLHVLPRMDGLVLEPSRVDLQGTAARVQQRLGVSMDAPPSTDERWVVHGDLYARHVAVARDPVRITGILDWGDICWGDRAVDLSLVYAFLPPDARSDFFAVYGSIDAWTQARARFFARYYGLVLLDYAADVQDATLLAEAHVITRLARA